MAADLTVVPIACLSDNFAYLLFDPSGDGSCAVVDACESEPVRREVEARGLHLRVILTTHHHWDHVGGNLTLSQQGDIRLFAHDSERNRVPGFTHGVGHGEEFDVLGRKVRALHVPGHTQGAVTYVIQGRAFTGDTLFCGGCGRLLEGTAEQLHDSLCRVLGELPNETVIYCGHEYTLANLEFARTLFRSEALQSRYRAVKHKRSTGEFCASAPLGVERETNPFLLCHTQELKEALGQDDALAAFRELRRRKDVFWPS